MTSRAPVIAVDALGIDQPGGARTAVLYLFQALAMLRPQWRFLIYLSRPEPLLAPLANVGQVIWPARKGLWARSLMQCLMPMLVWRHGVDLVHFTKSQGAILWGAKTVLTLFDVTTLHYPEFHTRSAVWYWRYLQPVVARCTDAIVTLTGDAARDIHKLLKVPAPKITVVPCAAQFESAVPDETAVCPDRAPLNGLPETYLFFVGIVAMKKNLATLIRALAVLRRRQLPVPTLVLAGPRYALSDAGEIFDLIKQLGLEPFVRYLGPVDKADLPWLYRQAALFVMPSVHEGFGIPCLEAMVCGTPVVASRASALPEVVGEAGVLVDDYMSPEAWAEAIDALLKDPQRRKELVERGRRRAQMFSWTRSAQILAGLYERLLNLPAHPEGG